MSELREFTNILDRASEPGALVTSKLERRIYRCLTNKEMMMAIFNPSCTEESKAQVAADVSNLYDVASKRRAVSAIAATLEGMDSYDLSRPTCAFLATIVNLGMATISEKAGDISSKMDHGDIDRDRYDRQMSKLQSYQRDLQYILKKIKKALRPKAKKLSYRSGVDVMICTSALFTVPGGEFINRHKLGFYVKSVLGNIYGCVDAGVDLAYNLSSVRWKEFFGQIFGTAYLPDIASLLLLEGADSIRNYKHADDVRDVWTSITEFALSVLNGSAESIRDQMIDLYLKRINKMFANSEFDLRVDLRTIDALRYSNLVQTIQKYRDKLDKVFAAAKKLANDKPASNPA